MWERELLYSCTHFFLTRSFKAIDCVSQICTMLLWDTQLINIFIDLCRTKFFSASLFPYDSSLKEGAITDNWAFKKPLLGIGYLTCSENSVSVRFIQCKFPWPPTLCHKCHVSHGGGLFGFCPPKGVPEAPVPTSSQVKNRTALQKLCNAQFSLRRVGSSFSSTTRMTKTSTVFGGSVISHSFSPWQKAPLSRVAFKWESRKQQLIRPGIEFLKLGVSLFKIMHSFYP